MRRLWLLGLALTAVSACKTSTNGAEAKEAATDGAANTAPLDVNDVSILFPLPRHYSDLNTMLPASLATDAGRSVLSEALFKDVVQHFKYTATINGKQVKLDSGTDFVFNKTRHPNEKESGPFNNYADWKIVAMRYDPCAPAPTHNLRGAAPQTQPLAAFDQAACLPQLRVTVQPILAFAKTNPANSPKDDDLQALNNDVPHAADFAMHLLFALTEAESREVFGRMAAFRQSCGGITAGMPLMVHPCLLAERYHGTEQLPHQEEVAAIIKKYANHYAGLAAMATQVGDDPWTFMNGTVADDKYQHLQIDAVVKVKDLHVNKQGVVVEPFSNGYYQMLSFLNVPQGGRFPTPTNNPRVTPTAYPDKVNVSLNAEFNTNQDTPSPDFFSRINQVENPLHNDFFSTDCVSCHGAASLGYVDLNRENTDLANAYYAKRMQSTGNAGWVVEAGAPEPTSANFPRRLAAPALFDAGATYMNLIDPVTLTHSIRDKPYALMHFGYLDARPSVSARAANESAKVAWQANHFYGSGGAPANICPKDKLRDCFFDSVTVRANSSWNDYATADQNWDTNLQVVSACMNQVCPQRAKELAPQFGSHWIQRIKTLKNVPLLAYPDAGVYIPKDTVIDGFRIDGVTTYRGDPDAKPLAFLRAPTRVPLKAKDGTDWYGVNIMPPDGAWDELFAPAP